MSRFRSPGWCQVRSLSILLGVLCALAQPAGAEVEVHPTIAQALERLYNFDFDGAHAILDQHIEARPEDPLGHLMRGGAFLFYELDRLKILESEFFKDDEKIGKKKLDPDLAIKTELMRSIDLTQAIAEARLAENGADAEALLALCLAQGLLTDYVGLVEKRKLKSLSSARQAERYARRLLAIDSSYYDAHLSSGVNEYLLGSLPFFVRWFVPIEGIEGDKARAFERLELVAERGSFLGPFARILMSIMALREKRPELALELLDALNREYPENPLIRKELLKVAEKLERGELSTAE